MSEYPQVTSERNRGRNELTVRRAEYQKHVFHLYDEELEPVIEHLTNLAEIRRFFDGAVFYSEYRDEEVQLIADAGEIRYLVAYLGDSRDDGARLKRTTIEDRITGGEWRPAPQDAEGDHG